MIPQSVSNSYTLLHTTPFLTLSSGVGTVAAVAVLAATLFRP